MCGSYHVDIFEVTGSGVGDVVARGWWKVDGDGRVEGTRWLAFDQRVSLAMEHDQLFLVGRGGMPSH